MSLIALPSLYTTTNIMSPLLVPPTVQLLISASTAQASVNSTVLVPISKI